MPLGSKLAGKLLLWWLVAAVIPVVVIETVLVALNVRAHSRNAAETQLVVARSLVEPLNTRAAIVCTRLESLVPVLAQRRHSDERLMEYLASVCSGVGFVASISLVDENDRPLYVYQPSGVGAQPGLPGAWTPDSRRTGTGQIVSPPREGTSEAEWLRLVRGLDTGIYTSRGRAHSLVVSLNPGELSQWLAGRDLPEGGNLLLVSPSGRPLGPDGPVQEGREDGLEGAVRSGRETLLAYEVGGRQLAGVFVPMKNLGGGLLLEREQLGILAMIEGARPGGLLLLFTGFLFLILMGQLMRRRISRPIGTLTESARRVAMGDYSARVDIKSGDEFEELGTTFNHMMEKVHRERDELESAYSLLSVLQGYNEQILEHAPNGIMVVDRRFRITGWNSYLERAFEIQRQDVLGKNLFAEFPTMEKEGVGAWLEEVYRSGEPKRISGWRHRTRNGGTAFLNVSISPICDEYREMVSAAMIIEDITDKTKVSDEARFFETMVKEAGETILSTDLSGRITLCNRAGESTFGYPANELIGQHISILLGENGRSIFVEILAKTEEGELWEGEVSCPGKSKEEVPVLFCVSRIEAGAGGAPALILVGIDLTDQKKAMEQIAYLRDLNDSIVASLRDGIIVIDCRKKVLAINEAAALRYGWNGQEVVGKRLGELLPQLEVEGRLETLRRTFEAGEKTILEMVESQRPEGAPMTETFTAYPLRRGGAVQGAVIVCEDVTNRMQRERQLEVLFEVSKALASTIDLEPLLERLVCVIREAFGFMYSAVFLVDEEKNELLLKSFSSDDPAVGPPEIRAIRICIDGAVGWSAYARETLVVPNVSTDARCVRTYEGQQSEMTIPLIREGKVVGVLDVGSRIRGGFTAEQRQMLEQLANQLAVAIVDSEMYEEAKMRVAELSALREVALAVSSVLDIDLLLDRFVDILQRSFGYARIAVLLVDQEKEELYIKAHRGYEEAEIGSLRLKVRTEGITGWVAHARQPLIVNDVERDPRFVGCASPVGSEIAVPLMRDEEVIGVLDVASQRKGAFKEHDLRIIQQVAAQIMIAFKNAILYEAAKSTVGELRALEGFNRSVLENIPSGIITVNGEGLITSVNATVKEVLGREEVGLVGQAVDSVVRIAPGGRCFLLEAVREGREVRRGEAHVILEDGREMDIGMSTSLLRGEGGEVTGAVGIITDLTDIKTMEEKVRRSDQLALLGQMSASMAHEIKNPLAGISTGVEYLMESFDKHDSRREASQLILQEISRLDRIVRDLTSFAHRPPLYLVPLDLREVAKRAFCLLQQEIRDQKIETETVYAEELRHVMGDEVQIGQVYLNLLLNAVQAMPDGGILRLSIHPERRDDRDVVVIEISDTGNGIAAEDLPKVFDPFFSTKSRGTGLGLAVTQRIVDDHGGTIHVASEQGRGTTIRVEFETRETAQITEPGNEPATMVVNDGIYDSDC